MKDFIESFPISTDQWYWLEISASHSLEHYTISLADKEDEVVRCYSHSLQEYKDMLSAIISACEVTLRELDATE